MSDGRGSGSTGASTGRPSLRTVVAGVIVLVVVALLLQNRDPVTVQLLLVDITGPQWLVGLVMFVLGGLTAWLLISRRARSR